MTGGPAYALLGWFRASRRDLPWRTPFPRDPYRALVAEVMLQQTRVDRVKDAYVGFLRRFPSLAALAAASEEEVTAAFSGLGYYRRARLLHAAARAIDAAGRFPETRGELARLPGFGPYTSAAVAAFSFGGSEPPVDGNVARVAARVGALALPLGSRALLAAGREFAASLYPPVGTPEVWEALMELGATVCTPRAPRCPSCPLADGCGARSAGAPERFPLPRPRRARESTAWVALWLRREDGRVLLRRVPEGSLLGGMWLPPFAAAGGGEDARAVALRLAAESGFGGAVERGPVVRHVITHRDIEVRTYTARLASPSVAEGRSGWSWRPPEAPDLPTSSLLAKLRRACSLAPSPEGAGTEG